MKNYFTTLNSLLCLFTFILLTSCSNDTEEIAPLTKSEAVNSEISARPNAREKLYTANINMLNNSGVMGMAELILNGDQLTVTIHADGLEPDMLHPQHIHGFIENNGNATCPPMSADTDGDGLIELGEGLPFYGAVLLPLMPFPMASSGTIDFTETYTIEDSLTPLQNRVIVLHGMTVDGEYVATLPVACGQIMPKRGR